MWYHILLNEEIEMIYLYAQNDAWLKEKLISKVHPLSWKIKRKMHVPHWEKKATFIHIYIKLPIC